MFYGNCKDGKPAKISAADLRLDANSDGVSVMDACCGCKENYGKNLVPYDFGFLTTLEFKHEYLDVYCIYFLC